MSMAMAARIKRLEDRVAELEAKSIVLELQAEELQKQRKPGRPKKDAAIIDAK